MATSEIRYQLLPLDGPNTTSDADPHIDMSDQNPPPADRFEKAIDWCSENRNCITTERAMLTGIGLGVAIPLITGIVVGAINKDAYLGFAATCAAAVFEAAAVTALKCAGGILLCCYSTVDGTMEFASETVKREIRDWEAIMQGQN